MRIHALRLSLLALLVGGVAVPAIAQSEFDSPSALGQPAALTAVHRSGQTFITWQEATGVEGEAYHIYRHTEPITAATLAQARRLTDRWGPLPEGSSRYYIDRARWDDDYTREMDQAVGYTALERYVITDRGAPLSDTTGLFVWTTKETGNFYYAVTTVATDGTENRAAFTAGNSLTRLVAESVVDPQPILVWQSPSGYGRVYTQFMDYERWNPTFDAPRDPDNPLLARGQQYAYNYWVGVPVGYDGRTSLPLYLHIEGWGSRYGIEANTPWEWPAIEIWGDDPHQSWYFGFSATFDYRRCIPWTGEGCIADTGPIVNYTEERLLRAVYDVLRDSYYNVDRARIYSYGQSMGGTGALALGIRYPNVFAAVYAGEPMTNYAADDPNTGPNWLEDYVPKWGRLEVRLPIENRGVYAPHLARYNGTSVWDWQNHQATLVNWRSQEMAYISIDHGTLDDIVEWRTQGRPVYGQFYAGRHAFSGAVVEADHSWLGFAGLGPNVRGDYAPFYNFLFRRDETIPALSRASGSLSVPPSQPGGFNLNLEWSASWHDFAGPPIDAPDRYEIALRSLEGVQTVDVTPRRVQRFVIRAGMRFDWRNVRLSDEQVIQSGAVTADAEGLVTITGFQVSEEGNRLVLQTASSGVASLSKISAQPPIAGAQGRTPVQGSDGTQSVSEKVAYRLQGSPMFIVRAPEPPVQLRQERHVTPDGVGPQEGDDPNYKHVVPDGTTQTHSQPAVRGLSPWAPAIAQPPTRRPFPDTTRGIHIFNDQLSSLNALTDEQVQFAATHYAGTQKMTRTDADRLRALNPNFLILHYRLGHALGYRTAEGNCQPTGEWLQIIDSDWTPEWPGDENVHESWFFHWRNQRVYNCDWGWYLAELNDASWRAWWQSEVLRQVQANDNDGMFMDSLSVPNFLGADHYNPALPDVDDNFERAWATRITSWLTWLQGQPLGSYYLLPNVGSWITSRETTDYSPADGLMIEGFALEADQSPYNYEDWQLQMNRILAAVNRGQIILAQNYVMGDQERMFTLGSYLLIKGNRTFLNIDLDLDPEWWPEYDIPIGAPIQGVASNITEFDRDGDAVYRRHFDNGFVLVNPTSPWDGSGVTRTIDLGGTFYLAETSGGGIVPESGIPTGMVRFRAVTRVTLPPFSAAVLLNALPASFLSPVESELERKPPTDEKSQRIPSVGTFHPLAKTNIRRQA